MHNSLILVNRTLPAEHFYSANNKAAKAILPLAAEASEEADLSSTRANDIAVDEPSAINFPADYKVLRTLAAQYALADFELLWETGIDGATRLFTVCRGTGDQLDSIDAARAPGADRRPVLNYYEHHIGDYAEATSHLSILEDGAYSRLLRKVYATERPLPADIGRVQRLIGARTDAERAAVETVLQEFFDLRDDGWHQERCDAAIEAYKAGAPEREIKKSNEVARQQRHRAERADLFKALHEAGQYPAWNTPITEVRGMVAKLPSASVTAPATPVTATITDPVTAYNGPGTATQSPVPTPQYPVPNTQNNRNLSSSDMRSNGDVGAPKAKPKRHFGTEDDHKAVRWMFERVREVDATAKEPNWDAWANDMRLMHEQDNRTHREARDLFGWANKDPFWRTNIFSPAKLRDNWQQLSLKRKYAVAYSRGTPITNEQHAAANAASDAEARRLLGFDSEPPVLDGVKKAFRPVFGRLESKAQ